MVNAAVEMAAAEDGAPGTSPNGFPAASDHHC